MRDRLRTPAELDSWVQARVSPLSLLAPSSDADVAAARHRRELSIEA